MASAYLLAATMGCGGATTHPRAVPPTRAMEASVEGREPTAVERREIRRLRSLAETIRDLQFIRPVPVRVQTRLAITKFVREQIDDEELADARVFYLALGLLPEELDIRKLLIELLGKQIVGYYDPERDLMVIREDVAAGLQEGGRAATHEAKMVIVHEYVHALQSQHLGLAIQSQKERSIDAENAFASLVEGDATLAMVGHMAAGAGQSLRNLTANLEPLRGLVRSAAEVPGGPELARAPPIVRVPLVTRYLEGMLFCAALHARRGWASVDRAFRSLPASTEQVLHPERYLSGEAPEAVALPHFPSLERVGWTPFEEDTLGELEMSIYFGGDAEDGRDAAAASGWGGDRIRVYRRGDASAVVWFSTWDRERDARTAEQAARRVAPDAPGSLVLRKRRALLILRGLPSALQPPVQRAFEAFALSLRDG